jgi:hypothetical protein
MSSIAGDFNRIHVMSGGAPKEIFALLAPKFEQQTGNKVKFTYAVITELREKLDAGATADVLVLPTPVLDSLAQDGKVRADSRASFGTVGIRVVVKEGATGYFEQGKVSRRDVGCPLRRLCHARKDAERPSHGQGDGAAQYRRRHGKEGNLQAGARRWCAIGGGG